ncbi:unnamed protein product [Prunus brigantina]
MPCNFFARSLAEGEICFKRVWYHMQIGCGFWLHNNQNNQDYRPGYHIIVKAKQLVHLLSIRIPVNQAIRLLTLMSDMHGDIIQLGDEEISGLCSKFGVTQVGIANLFAYI